MKLWAKQKLIHLTNSLDFAWIFFLYIDKKTTYSHNLHFSYSLHLKQIDVEEEKYEEKYKKNSWEQL